jgi:hypothetical protein
LGQSQPAEQDRHGQALDQQRQEDDTEDDDQQCVAPDQIGRQPDRLRDRRRAALYVVRTSLEDKLLKVELPGYEDYAHRTRFRLAPGIW